MVAPVVGDGLESPHLVVNNAGDLAAGYVYAGEHPLMRFGPDGPVYYLTDVMGSVISLADGAGENVARFIYDGFGNLRTSSGPAADLPSGTSGDFRFHGAWLESASGLYHFRARDYDPHVGRFLSRDPADPDLNEPESLHPYAFVYSNPHVYRDPTGMFSLIQLNMSLSIQDILQHTQTLIHRQTIAFLKDKIGEAATDLIVGALRPLIPGGWMTNVLNNYLNHDDQGNLLDPWLKKQVCGFLRRTPFYNRIWIEAEVHTNGDPENDGFGCSDVDSSFLPINPALPNPDFIFKEGPPTRVLTNNEKGYIIGDLKLSVRTLRNALTGAGRGENRQWSAITGFAKRHQYAPVVLFITWRGGARDDEEAILEQAIINGVGVLIFVIAD